MRFSDILPLHAPALNEAIDPSEGPSRYWFVLGKNGLARCVNENDSDLFTLQKQGWDVVWDSAKSVEEGLKRAHDQWGLLPWDDMDPIALKDPRVMYRSVSLPELKDIVQTGAITGKGSSFNGTETRRWTFFADKISKNLIWQGEDHQRFAQVSLDGNALHAKHAQVAAALKAVRAEFVEAAQGYAAEWSRRNAGRAEPMVITPDEITGIMHGSHSKTMDVYDRVRYAPSMEAIRKEMRALETQQRALNDKFRHMIGQKTATLAAKIADQMYSSAIVETKPLTGGLHYSKDHGKSYFGHDDDGVDQDEFTFPSGSVKVSDLTKVHWVKDGKIVATSTVEAVPGILRRLNQKIAA